ncbi:hypothetical protein FRUB_05465 [Fimbriiglobus ruber]|uniref:Uncharacterized protein n=1 Tax=Fimbriiglobus ruber TaxID=1908690 RepID=A0A225DSF8_9BACT|nr:hypothetical protein FRUB_05465 [Fimbriiglobus ruber]
MHRQADLLEVVRDLGPRGPGAEISYHLNQWRDQIVRLDGCGGDRVVAVRRYFRRLYSFAHHFRERQVALQFLFLGIFQFLGGRRDRTLGQFQTRVEGFLSPRRLRRGRVPGPDFHLRVRPVSGHRADQGVGEGQRLDHANHGRNILGSQLVGEVGEGRPDDDRFPGSRGPQCRRDRAVARGLVLAECVGRPGVNADAGRVGERDADLDSPAEVCGG